MSHQLQMQRIELRVIINIWSWANPFQMHVLKLWLAYQSIIFHLQTLYCVCTRSICFLLLVLCFANLSNRNCSHSILEHFEIQNILHMVSKIHFYNILRNIYLTLLHFSLKLSKHFLSSNSWKYFLKD